MTVNMEAVQRFFQSQWIQKTFLVVFLIICFWDGLWGGAPRADQVIYLHKIQQYGNFYEIIVNSISWNRIGSNPGDVLLFRPVLFVQMGIFFYLFKYNFFAWQLAGLVLHILTVLTLHSIFIQGALKKTIFPILLSALFGCAFFASELVYWSHISGYITYCFLFLLQTLFLVKYFKNNNEISLVLALVFGLLAEFTYELGVVQNIIIFIIFVVRYFSLPAGSVRVLKIGALFLMVSLVYPITSYFDLALRGLTLGNNLHPQTTDTFKLGLVYSFQELEFWFRGMFFPHLYLVAAEDRASLQGKGPLDLIFWTSMLAVTGVFWIIVLSAQVFCKKYILSELNKIGVIFVFSVFLLIYAAIIAYGRAIPRGIDYVFNINLYYAYISYIIFFAGIAVFYSFEKKYLFNIFRFRGRISPAFFYAVFLLFFIEENFFSTSQLGARYRYNFSAERLRLINYVEKLAEGDLENKNGYFVLDKSCVALPPLPWLSYHIDEKFKGFQTPPTLADALFSKYSFLLNEGIVNDKSVYIKTIECEKVSVSSQLGAFGSGGLMTAAEPGWHAASPVVFPQEIDIKFIEARSIRGIRLLFQDGLTARGPRQIEIIGDVDKGISQNITSTEVDCKSESSVWRDIAFKDAISVSGLKLIIRSNCGDPNLLTLRGLKFID